MNNQKESKTKAFIVNAMIVILVLSLSANVYQYVSFKEKKMEKLLNFSLSTGASPLEILNKLKEIEKEQ